MIEFLRLGSRIPGQGIGCCAVDVIQGFGCDPAAQVAVQMVDGDSVTPCLTNGEQAYLGPTNLDVFKQRLRLGTFYTKEMPCHAFLAVFSDGQINGYNDNGKKWLAIIKDHGFEFIRSVKNSVYSASRPPVYVFGLFRNIGEAAVEDPFTPPKAWTDLPECSLNQQQVWDRDSTRLMTEAELRALGVPVWLAGKPGEQPRVKPKDEIDLLAPLEEDDSELYDDNENDFVEFFDIEDVEPE